jgi:hypothetical protein
LVLKIFAVVCRVYAIHAITDSIPVIDCDTIPIDREIRDHDGTYVSIDLAIVTGKPFSLPSGIIRGGTIYL